MAIYETVNTSETPAEPTITLKEIPIYGGSRLGQYRTSYSTIEGERVADKKTALGQRVYEFSNHLQNVLVVLADFKVPVTDGTATEFKAIVVSANDYYPFGMVMGGGTNPDGTDKTGDRAYRNTKYDYRYGFNGKEDDKDFGDKQLIQDYGFRLYNPAIARFLSVDPLAPSYPWYTPYQFAGNKPIIAIDLDGLEEKTVITYWFNSLVYSRIALQMSQQRDISAYFRHKNMLTFTQARINKSFWDDEDADYSYRKGAAPSPNAVGIEMSTHTEEIIGDSYTEYRFILKLWLDPEDHSKGWYTQPLSFAYEEKNGYLEMVDKLEYDLHNNFSSFGISGTATFLGVNFGVETHYLVKGSDRFVIGYHSDFDPISFTKDILTFNPKLLDIGLTLNFVYGSSSLPISQRNAKTMQGLYADIGGAIGVANYSYTQNLNSDGTGGDAWRMNNIGVTFGLKGVKTLKSLDNFSDFRKAVKSGSSLSGAVGVSHLAGFKWRWASSYSD